MAEHGPGNSLTSIFYTLAALALGGYFAFAALQGDYGLFRRLQAEVRAEELAADLSDLEIQIAAMQNRTRRLSDAFLDLDLLDEQARRVLGLIRADEMVIR